MFKNRLKLDFKCKLHLFFLLTCIATLITCLTPIPTPEVPEIEVLAKASPDECYYQSGGLNEYDPDGFNEAQCISNGGQAKTNESNIWGLTKYQSQFFFGTFSNALCLTLDQYLDWNLNMSNADNVCEMDDEFNVNPLAVRDFRPPSIFVYNNDSRILTKIAVSGEHESRRQLTVGLRSAGNHDGVVFLAGPALAGPGDITINGINIFAIDAVTNTILDSITINQYTNVRQMIVANNVLYIGVGGPNGGAVLKWTGDKNDPFQFEVVGSQIDGLVSYMALHNGRIFVTTWPYFNENSFELPDDLTELEADTFGVWMSPLLDPNLNSSDANNWQKVFSVYDYEVDEVIALSYGGGALASYKGWLYWGTMHVPMLASGIHELVHGSGTLSIALIFNTQCNRQTPIFRGRNFENSNKAIELLYGDAELSKYVPGVGWTMETNNMGGAGKYGKSGFGNFYNGYAWTMAVYKEKLYIGTLDWGQQAGSQFYYMLPNAVVQLPAEHGADLYYFSNENSPAIMANNNGLDNKFNYGFRTIISDDYLYIGTVNPYNLNPNGGWELIRYSGADQ